MTSTSYGYGLVDSLVDPIVRTIYCTCKYMYLHVQGTGSVVILEQNYVYSAYMPLAFEQFFLNYLREIRDQHSSSSSSNLNF